jgi:hypothetical protein
MREILTRKREIAAAVGSFRRAIADIAPTPRKAEWTFPNGERLTLTTYALATRSARLMVGLPLRAAGRVPHLFHLERDEATLTPDVELTVPIALDRRQSGVYVRDGAATLLATRGSFSASGGKIARERVFRHFAKWLLPARDGNAQASVIPLVAVDSPTLGADLMAFVRAVILFKIALRDGESDEHMAWREPTATTDTAARDYMHGQLAHALETRLRELTLMSGRYSMCRNRELDMALVDTRTNRAAAIFEIETSMQPEVHLHTAVGRLLHFRQRYGDTETRLLLVLPVDTKHQVFVFKGFFETAGIEVLLRSGADFHSLDDVPLAQMLDRTLAG